MKVNNETAEKLNCIKNLLEKEISTESDAKGVYDRLVKKITEENENYNISLGEYGQRMNYIPGVLSNPFKKFNNEEIKDIAKNKFARYCFYDLRKKEESEIFPVLKRQIREYAHDNMNKIDRVIKEIESVGATVNLSASIHFHNWLFGLEKVAEQASFHRGTPLEAVD